MDIENSLAYDLLELDIGDDTGDWLEDGFPLHFKLVEETLDDSSRWSLHYSRVYEDLETGRFYETSYRRGATECQDERPYEYDGETIEFVEVFKQTKTITVYTNKGA